MKKPTEKQEDGPLATWAKEHGFPALTDEALREATEQQEDKRLAHMARFVIFFRQATKRER
ncbi:MAG: hypothetical protein XU15_C0011G0041 [candidate division NC10 bacterium CSP1-5]|nr:MAG: hypothetical protein XU15_C0011G0041 [candidate division NC10 bacterium CSP1-5]